MELSFENIKNTVKEILDAKVEFSYLVGSAGTERFHDESDIDLVVFWKETPANKDRTKAWIDLESKFNRDLELVTLSKIDIIFARQVLETGRLLWSNNDGLLLQWKMEVLSEYPDFKRSRKIIEDNILNRKKYV